MSQNHIFFFLNNILLFFFISFFYTQKLWHFVPFNKILFYDTPKLWHFVPFNKILFHDTQKLWHFVPFNKILFHYIEKFRRFKFLKQTHFIFRKFFENKKIKINLEKVLEKRKIYCFPPKGRNYISNVIRLIYRLTA